VALWSPRFTGSKRLHISCQHASHHVLCSKTAGRSCESVPNLKEQSIVSIYSFPQEQVKVQCRLLGGCSTVMICGTSSQWLSTLELLVCRG